MSREMPREKFYFQKFIYEADKYPQIPLKSTAS